MQPHDGARTMDEAMRKRWAEVGGEFRAAHGRGPGAGAHVGAASARRSRKTTRR